MAYGINITARAERDLAHLYEDINATDSAAARKPCLSTRREFRIFDRPPISSSRLSKSGGGGPYTPRVTYCTFSK